MDNIEMDYKRKYAIYKQKYLNLKGKMLGGNGSKDPEDLLETKTRVFIDSLKGTTPIYKLTPEEARKVLNNVQSDQSYKETVDIQDFSIDLSDNKGKANFSIIRPKDRKNDILPVIFYVHGAGWVLGGMQTHGRLLSELANKIGAAVVYFDYGLAPEHKFPTQINQMYEVMKHVVDKASDYKLDNKKLVIMGDSVGGNMATVLTMLSNEKGGPKISYQVLLYPVTDASMSTGSYQTYQNGPWLTKKAMEWFFNAYEPDEKKRELATISPINATSEHIKGMPSTLIITDENDVLRDEGENYAHKLMNEGIDVTSVRYLGTIHDFLMLDPLKDTPAAKSALKLITVHVKDAIGNKN